MVSAKAAVVKADEAISVAASAPHVLRVIMTFLPGKMTNALLSLKKPALAVEVRKAFPNPYSAALAGRQGGWSEEGQSAA
jgi:hypothetical protein